MNWGGVDQMRLTDGNDISEHFPLRLFLDNDRLMAL